ncbi:MAG: serine/threonine-protein kinase, partial [Gemmatimonadota bacterium]
MTLLSERITLGLSDRYRVEREIGAGAAATVYLAEDLRHKRYVAIKVLRPELGTTVAGERFLREIEIVAQLLHPHILGIIDSGSANGLLFYVMPFVEGETLRQRIEREHDLPIDEALRVVRDVADALAYAHRRGVVHRDIKPENVLLFEQHALVTDFGIARAIVSARQARDNAGDQARITAPGVSLGTPTYMAPEQAAGDSDVDHRADLYALGIMAYELLVGAPPFTGPTAQHVIAAQVARVPEPLSRVRRTIPPAVEKLVMRCLEKRPADRWQSAAEFVHALDTLRVGDTAERAAARGDPIERRFRLTEEVCRRLNRATLDPRIIGDEVHYLDNHVASDVVVFYLHGMGLDHTSFEHVLRQSPYRGVAISLYGFAPTSRRRLPLSIEDHAAIVSELLRDVVTREHPHTSVLAGVQSGADFGFRMIASAPSDQALPIDAFLSLGCNLSLETCFVSRPFAQLSGQTEPSIEMLQRMAQHVASLREWMYLNDHLLRILRKFSGDLSGLQRHAQDTVRAFSGDEPHPFDRWFREASTRVAGVRCVFEESPVYARLVQETRLRHLDHGVLGPRYREDSIIMEP